jgi:hypothetical protein
MKSRRQPELPLFAPDPLAAPPKPKRPPKVRTLPLDHPERPRNRVKGDLGQYLYPTPARPKS